MSGKTERAPQTVAGVDRSRFDAWLAASCERQGVPVKIADPGVAHQITVLFGKPQRQRLGKRSNPPAGLHAVDVEHPTPLARSDDRVIEHRFDNRMTALERQVRPLAA